MHRYSKDRDPVGLILRTHASNPADVGKRVSMLESLLANPVVSRAFKRVDILIHADERFAAKDRDCGELAGALKRNPSIGAREGVHVEEVKHGDLFCEILNYGMAKQARLGCEYSVVLSPDAGSYLTEETMAAILAAASKGALAVGVAINELAPSIRQGRLANTFCLWHIQSLQVVGGFDSMSSKPSNGDIAFFLHDKVQEKDVSYQLAGVEEVVPLARMVRLYGPCLAAVEPQGGPAAYEVPDPVTQPDLYERHLGKLGTKLQRQIVQLGFAGFALSYLKGGLMKV